MLIKCKMIRSCICLLFCLITFASVQGQSTRFSNNVERSELTREYVYPTRVIWKSGDIRDVEILLKTGIGQASLNNEQKSVWLNKGNNTSSVVLDFGRELHGAVEFVTGMWGGGNVPRNVRVRLGESVSEVMAELGEHGSTNDHAMRDFQLALPWLGKNQTGESGFRFIRIDFLDPDAELQLKEVRAIFTYRDIPYVGTFKSSDERLNKIWEVGAYTVHLNMQDYLWDGIKRDRLVWVGDLHPEVSTIMSVFGQNPVVPKSLDLARDITPMPQWMSGISTYSMWWIIIHYDWFLHYGDRGYLQQQQPYLTQLVDLILKHVDGNKEKMGGNRFLDWPSSEDSLAVHAGLQAMTILALEKASLIFQNLQDESYKKKCDEAVKSLKSYKPNHNGSKQAAALMALAGLMDPEEAYQKVLSVGKSRNFSTFYGYYMLQAMAKAGKYQEAMDVISEYWGAMLDLGATTFWEDFNIEWAKNAARIDELVPAGKVDIHATYGDYCYVGHRHSLCHGWASGPTAWLTEHVLGIKVLETGSKTILVKPNLGDLKFAEGTFPTPYGALYVRHDKQSDGTVKSTIKAPKGVKIVRK